MLLTYNRLQWQAPHLPPVSSETTVLTAFLARSLLFISRGRIYQFARSLEEVCTAKDSPMKFSPHLVAFKKRSLLDWTCAFISDLWSGHLWDLADDEMWDVRDRAGNALARPCCSHCLSFLLQSQGSRGKKYLWPTCFDRKSFILSSLGPTNVFFFCARTTVFLLIPIKATATLLISFAFLRDGVPGVAAHCTASWITSRIIINAVSKSSVI